MHELNGKHVIVLGFGRQGRALARWLPTQGAHVTVSDRRTSEQLLLEQGQFPQVDFVLGEHPLTLLDDADLICISGGVPLTLSLIQEAVERGVAITNDAQLFMERCKAPVVGITGSAGKTTTTTLTTQIIQAAGYNTYVGGNIGDVLLDDLDKITPDDVVIMELSSFQLELMTTSPRVAAVLNITPNHLDRHKTMQNYIAAKANILRHQYPGDVAVLCKDDEISESLEPLVIADELVWFSMYDIVPNGTFLMGDRLMLAGSASYDYVPHVLMDRAEVPLLGDHNVMNVLAACAIAGALGLALDRPGIEPETMRQVVCDFKPVPHRLEKVRDVNGVTYINDSIATAPERLVAALRSFDERLVLLLGGADKDLPWQEAVHLALQKADHIILFGREGDKQVRTKVMRMLRLMGADQRHVSSVETLDEAVLLAQEVAQPGHVVLLSPGGTSYDAYPDFEARGEHFRKIVSKL
ncbi:UDP-N-acetylmuramoyl-L-alanine--D-glutamate ligase [Phototrophicus methaneseepsis]|uniref:UDP-N-acetylmuramoylalanine--D-glutamate ligase n=1 Tax=Phototrophicus methaneseepsis TaxID=2710758 RepID=A0A7S8IE05_9CHLR|nr:UDP-N-acetylmuramoyl-L-alanine--D-glutamate ligase [Phototrophicus methaneseepsis]QPC81929.1 UDP-N-acetylmuramoyl-L-alanine--D-glutamate ligase [Phototrophicus methaneseepsis]